MKNWITIIEDEDTTVAGHFPVARVKTVVEAKDLFIIHLEKGSIHVKGADVQRLVQKVLTTGKPILKKATAGIESVKYNRGS